MFRPLRVGDVHNSTVFDINEFDPFSTRSLNGVGDVGVSFEATLSGACEVTIELHDGWQTWTAELSHTAIHPPSRGSKTSLRVFGEGRNSKSGINSAAGVPSPKPHSSASTPPREGDVKTLRSLKRGTNSAAVRSPPARRLTWTQPNKRP